MVVFLVQKISIGISILMYMTESLNFDQYFIITHFCIALFFQGTRVEEVQGTMVCEVFTRRLASKRRTKFWNTYHVVVIISSHFSRCCDGF